MRIGQLLYQRCENIRRGELSNLTEQNEAYEYCARLFPRADGEHDLHLVLDGCAISCWRNAKPEGLRRGRRRMRQMPNANSRSP
jgi:hypothetical protein